MLVVPLLAALAVLALVLLLFLRQRYSYWSSRKVLGPRPVVPFGNFTSSWLRRETLAARLQAIYDQFPNERYVGVYFAHYPLLLLRDPDIIKSVFVSEFQDFNGRGVHCDPQSDPLSGNLFSTSGSVWRNLRVKLSPAFSTGKLRYMFERVQECSESMRTALMSRLDAEGGSTITDIKAVFDCFTTDLIASMVFGLEVDTFRNPDSEFRQIGKMTFEPSFAQSIRLFFSFFAPVFMKIFRLKFMLPEVNDFFLRLVRETVAYREEHGVQRADLMNLMLHLKNNGFVPPDSSGDRDKDQEKLETLQKLSTNEIAAQASIFFLAGFETTSTTSSLAIYEMSKRPELLEKAIEETDAIMKKYKGVLTYQGVMEAKYLDQVVQETLRFYPGIMFLTRQAARNVLLPGTDLMLDQGTTLLIPSVAIHTDPEYWPDPLRFDPDRFSEGYKESIPQNVYMPFGSGPRTCIGQRLSQLEVKVAIMTLLHNFTLSTCSATPKELKSDPRMVTFTPMGGVYFRLRRRT